jgi:hypothetical protein
MTRDEIIRMAREAGMHRSTHNLASNPVQHRYSYDGYEENLERFAALVAADAREACARMAEAFHQHGYDFTGDLELHEAIRARSQS